MRVAKAFKILGEGSTEAFVSRTYPNVLFVAANGWEKMQIIWCAMVCLGDIGHVSKHGPRSIA